MVEKVYIITPCYRPANLDLMFKSIDFDLIYRWYIVYDTTRNRTYTRKYPGHPKIIELESSDVGISGNAQRNAALNIVEDGFVYFLDDDNVVHPDLWVELPKMTSNHYYSWDQLRNPEGDDTDWVLFKNEKGKILKGDTLKLQRIDTAQVLIPKKFFEGLQWKTDDYKADGILIESVYKKNPSAHIYLPKILCYYNSLG